MLFRKKTRIKTKRNFRPPDMQSKGNKTKHETTKF